MGKVRLGKTEIVAEKNAFGALPIQRVSLEKALRLLHMAFDGGIRFFDTARYYSDSEEKLGVAFEGMRSKIYIATKTGAVTAISLPSASMMPISRWEISRMPSIVFCKI